MSAQTNWVLKRDKNISKTLVNVLWVFFFLGGLVFLGVVVLLLCLVASSQKQLIIGLGYPLKAQLIAMGFIKYSFNDVLNFLTTKNGFTGKQTKSNFEFIHRTTSVTSTRLLVYDRVYIYIYSTCLHDWRRSYPYEAKYCSNSR